MRSEWACNEAAHAIAEREGEESAAAFERRKMSCVSSPNTVRNDRRKAQTIWRQCPRGGYSGYITRLRKTHASGRRRCKQCVKSGEKESKRPCVINWLHRSSVQG